MIDTRQRSVFLLCGYAGTGKTSVISSFVRMLDQLNRKVVLLAPTGRAAKVIEHYSGHHAATIHRQIYRQTSAGFGRFVLAPNMLRDTLFVVDEASMISNTLSDSLFGSGNLLRDLIDYVFSGCNCRLMLLGDTAQLPPVGQNGAPALDIDVLQAMNLNVTYCLLTEVARQALDSGILANATHIRKCLDEHQISLIPQFILGDFTDICLLPHEDFAQTLQQCYDRDGIEETIVITRTNRRTNIYNNAVRTQMLFYEDELETGERLMVSRNNYFFSMPAPSIPNPILAQAPDGHPIKADTQKSAFIANGDLFTLRRLRNVRELYGLRFADAILSSEDYDTETEALVCLDTLHTDTPEHNNELWQQLFLHIAEDFPHLTRKADIYDAVFASPYYNALHLRYAYAVTCHKAQGGQWRNVFVDPGVLSDDRLGEDFYRWLYTAVTRATARLFLLSFPTTQDT